MPMRTITKDTNTGVSLDCCGAETDPWLRIVLEKLVAHYKRHEDIAEAPAGLAAGECPTVPFFTVELDFTLARV